MCVASASRPPIRSAWIVVALARPAEPESEFFRVGYPALKRWAIGECSVRKLGYWRESGRFKKKVPGTDAKEVAVGNRAEETYCHRALINIPEVVHRPPTLFLLFVWQRFSPRKLVKTRGT